MKSGVYKIINTINKKPKNCNRIKINGIDYDSQADAAKAFNVSMGTMSNWVSGKIIKKGNYYTIIGAFKGG